MTTVRPPDKRRTKSEATRQRILDAATSTFLEEGYSNTSLERVANMAGVTKPTVYSHFDSKKGLFDAVIHHNAKYRLDKIDEILVPSGDLENDLVRFGDFLLNKLFSPNSQRWDRLAAVESMTHPEVGATFFQQGPAKVIARIAGYLKAQKQAGRIDIDHPERAAEQLIGMFLGLDLLRTQIGQKASGSASRKRRCREAVAVFLKGHGATS